MEDLAKRYQLEFLALMDSPAFKLFMEQMGREIRRAEVNVLTVGSEANLTTEQVTMRLRDAQGFLRGLKHVMSIPEEMLTCFTEGRVPWLEGQKWPGE